jgi:hypothetical protein
MNKSSVTMGFASICALWISTASIAEPATWKPPRTTDGKPEMSGVWTNASVTYLTRPPGVTKLAVTRDEAVALVKANPFQRLIEAEDGPSDLQDGLLEDGNNDRGYNAFWIDTANFLGNVNGEYRTSWIVEPANGQLPLSDVGKARIQAARARRQSTLFDGPEALPLPERCLIGFSGAGGPGMLNTIYNSNYQIVQTPGSMLILVEMVHDARIIPIFKDRAAAQAGHRPAALHQWLGDSVGWWEGDTFVAETVNVHPQQQAQGPIYFSERGKVTERFTRISAEQTLYEFEVDDPVYYTQPWRAQIGLSARNESVYEYACHEGNYAMENILRGARTQEAQGIKPALGPGIFGTPIPTKKTADAR